MFLALYSREYSDLLLGNLIEFSFKHSNYFVPVVLSELFILYKVATALNVATRDMYRGERMLRRLQVEIAEASSTLAEAEMQEGLQAAQASRHPA